MKKHTLDIRKMVAEYLESQPEVIFAYLFGSAADSGSYRDVDVAVYVTDKIQIGDGYEYAMKLSRELERLTGNSVDVIIMNSAPDHLIHSISSGALLVNRNDDARVHFISRSWSRYFDIQAKRRDYLRLIAEESGSREQV